MNTETRTKLIRPSASFPRIPGCKPGYRVQVNGRIVGQVGACYDGSGWIARLDDMMGDFFKTRAAAVAKLIWYVDGGYAPGVK